MNFINYNDSIDKIKKISESVECGYVNKFCDFLRSTAKFIIKMAQLEKNLNDEYFKNKTFDELLEENHQLYSFIKGENYNNSYCNPTYAVEIFGKELGDIVTVLAFKYSKYIEYAFCHEIDKMAVNNDLFLRIYKEIKEKTVDANEIKDIIAKFEKEAVYFNVENTLKETLIETKNHNRSVIENDDLNDLRYLFKYGKYITENEIKTAKFLCNYNNVELIADTVCNGYINGFIRDGKNHKIKSASSIMGIVGQEKIIKVLIEKLKKHGHDVIIRDMESTSANKQYGYDHRFDNSLYFDEEYVTLREEAYSKAMEKYKKELKEYGGVLAFEKFGEVPFAPESKKDALKLNEQQSKLMQRHRSNLNKMRDTYIPEEEVSFTIIAFPIPEIGDNFEEIFEQILKINLLNSKEYEEIQKHIIDVLDKGEFIHVKGKGTNKTNIKVKMHEIKNPEKETNFENCVADVNIPVGEVFTSPILKGTNGTLHVEEVFLNDLGYKNLELKFKDGYIEEYTCTNFENEEDNKKYIEENLLFPHKTLPMGEFAIGTNTLAYVVAENYKIVNKLPILIVEKMGPHFAIGDTCFSYCEDTKVYNPDKKEIIARDNEKSILRKTNIHEAYTGRHTDITLPYDGIEFISAITKDGEELPIIKEGRFVVKGAEKLNEPFNK